MDPKWNYVDVYGFDPELLAMIPRPVQAIIFLFPITEAYEKFKAEEEAHLTKCGQYISPEVVFFKQTISNACGMIALLHSVGSNDDEIIGKVLVESILIVANTQPLPPNYLGPGLFNDIISKAKKASTEERVELLENSAELASVHEAAAYDGQTVAPDREYSIDLHFVCFIEVDQHLYELDGRKAFPINHGKCTDLVKVKLTVTIFV